MGGIYLGHLTNNSVESGKRVEEQRYPGFARTTSISSQSVSSSVRSQIAKLFVPFIWMALVLHSQYAIKVSNGILTARLLQNSYSSWESEIEMKQALKSCHSRSGCRHVWHASNGS